MTAELQDANSRSRLRTLTVEETGLRDLDRPVRASMEFDIPGHFAGEGEREGSLTDSKVWSRLLAYNLDPDRQASLDLGSPSESVHHYTVQLPAAYRFDGIPRAHAVCSQWGSFEVTVMPDLQDAHRLDVYFHTRLDKTRVEPGDFAAFRKFHEEVNKYWRVWLTLKPTENLEDSPLLEKLLASASGDDFSAATLARLYAHHGKTEEARRVLRKALSSYPDSATLWELTVKTATSLEEEETAYREMVRRFADEPKYAVALGATRVKRGDHAGAHVVLEPLAKKGSDGVRSAAYYQLARSAFLENKAAAALEHLEAAGQADPETMNTLAALQFKGQVHERLGQVAQAASAYRQALKVEGEANEALAALIRLELAGGPRAEALTHLRRYTLAVGEDPEGLAAAAEFHLRLGRYDDALELASRAQGKKSGARAQRVLGLVFLHRGDYGQAVAHLEKAEQDGPVVLGLIRTYLALGRLSDAERLAGAANVLAAANPELRQALDLVATLGDRRRDILASAHTAEQMESYRQAASALVCAEQAQRDGRPANEVQKLLAPAFSDVELGPASALRGQLALERGRLTRALADAQRAILLSPREARGYLVRGRVRLERGDNGALADLLRAGELTERKDATVLHWLAAALFQAGNHLEALTVQREALRLRPEDPELTEQLHEFERVKTPASNNAASRAP